MASPQVRTVEYDLSQRVAAFPGMYGIIIGNFDKGPVNTRQFISNSNELDLIFGKPKVGSDVAYFIAQTFLQKSQRLYVERVVDTALYGAVSIGAAYNTDAGTGNAVLTAFNGTLVEARCHPSTVEVYLDFDKVGYDNGSGVITGTNLAGTIDYETGAYTLTFTTAPPTGAKVWVRWGLPNVALSVGIADPAAYAFNSRLLTQAIAFSGLVYNDKIVPINLVPPTAETVASQTDASVKIYDGTTLVAYADENGDLVDAGTNLDGAATNTVSYASGVIQFTLDSGYTPTNPLIVEYYSYEAESMLIAQDNPGAWGASYQILVDRIDPVANSFRYTVYEVRPKNALVTSEQYTLSRKHQTDGFERQMQIEDRINGKSYYSRFVNNPYLDETVPPQDFHAQNNVTAVAPMNFGGGTNGSVPAVSAWINRLNTYNNKEDIKVDIVIDTLGDTNYQLAIASLTDRELGGRGDCYGVLYVPFEKEETTTFATDIVNYRKYELNLSTSFNGLYTGFVKVYDAYNGRELWIPNTGFVAAAFSYTADQFEPWFPAAGWRRGVLPVKDVYRHYTLGERDLLYDNDVNTIRFKPGRGIAIWGQKTLYGTASALDRANVRWLLIVIENAIESYLENYEFELNDGFTRSLAKAAVSNYLASIQVRRGLYDYEVVCDTTNNTPETIDNYEMFLDYYVQPARSAETIYGRAIITRTGVNFDSVRISGSIADAAG